MPASLDTFPDVLLRQVTNPDATKQQSSTPACCLLHENQDPPYTPMVINPAQHI
jgi:hypothetical protein